MLVSIVVSNLDYGKKSSHALSVDAETTRPTRLDAAGEILFPGGIACGGFGHTALRGRTPRARPTMIVFNAKNRKARRRAAPLAAVHPAEEPAEMRGSDNHDYGKRFYDDSEARGGSFGVASQLSVH